MAAFCEFIKDSKDDFAGKKQNIAAAARSIGKDTRSDEQPGNLRPSAQEPQDGGNGNDNGGFDLGGQPLAELIEAPAFDTDQVYMLRASLGVQPATDLNGFPDTDAMPAHRAWFHIGQSRPVENVNGPRSATELHGIDHHQSLLAIEFFEEINPPQAEITEPRAGGQAAQFQAAMDGLPHSVIGNQVVADADHQGAAHGYCRARLKARLKVQLSPVETVLGRAGQPASSAMMPAI